jgi:peptidoglycan L-alanyl-D-glutamate endopeptidase CwlK
VLGFSETYPQFSLDATSLAKLKGVHPDLVKVVLRAAETITQPFVVFEGVRTLALEKSYNANGVSALTSPYL